MKKMLTLLVCLLAIATFFISCNIEQSDDLATVRLSIDSERSRSIAPTGGVEVNNVAKYKFSFIQESNSEYTFEMDKNGTGSYVMTGIKSGEYTLLAEALNGDGMTVSMCTLEGLKISRGYNTFNVSFQSLNSTQTGRAEFTVKWKHAEYTGEVSITGRYERMNGTGENITFTDGVRNGEYSVSTAALDNLSIGSYRLTIEGKVGGKTMFAINEVIIIAPNKTTTISHDFSNSVAVSEINIVDTLTTPLVGTLSVKETATWGDVAITLNITSNLPESIYKDEEGNIKDIYVIWFMEDYNIGNTTIKYNPSGTTKTINANAFFGPANYSAIFYLDGSDESLGSAEIRANYDVTTGKII